jgi:hypothetical protein
MTEFLLIALAALMKTAPDWTGAAAVRSWNKRTQS